MLHLYTLFDEVDINTMVSKLKEELVEVIQEIEVDKVNKDLLAGELLDLIQCAYGIAYKNNIDLKDYIQTHNNKLKSRGLIVKD